MKQTVKIEQEVEFKTVLVEVQPRYIGDDDYDDMPTNTPLLDGDMWRLFIDIDTGKINDWPEGVEQKVFIKVCDSGLYTLYDNEGNEVTKKDGYVPNALIPGEYGDYIEMDIGSDGVIKNWPTNPNVSEFFPSDD